LPAKVLISDNDRQLIRRLYEDDLLFATEIGRKLGLARWVVKRILGELKVESRGSFRPIPVGTEFNGGQLKVVAEAPPTVKANGWKQTNVRVHCRCNGPNSDFVVPAATLRSGGKKSCGCVSLSSPSYRPHPNREWGRILKQYSNNHPDFALCLEQVKYICSQPCFYCGGPRSNKLKGRRYRLSTGRTVLLYSGVDEVIHGKGHVVGNVLPCCYFCNMAKSDSTLEDWCQYAHKDIFEVREAARMMGEALERAGNSFGKSST
jgi:hypothetical protein